MEKKCLSINSRLVPMVFNLLRMKREHGKIEASIEKKTLPLEGFANVLSSFADGRSLFVPFLQSTVAGETGPPGALAVNRVGLVLVSGAGNAIIRPQVPVVNSVRDFL